jgi:ketosteroid isomerase-like protein
MIPFESETPSKETGMTEQEKRTIAQEFIRGLGARDGNLLRSIMTEDVVWSLPGDSPMSGEAHGVEAILKRANTLHGFNVNIEVEHVVFGLHDVALHLHNTGRYSGKVLDEHLTTVIHLDEGKIRRLDTFISDVPMLNSYFVKERSD